MNKSTGNGRKRLRSCPSSSRPSTAPSSRGISPKIGINAVSPMLGTHHPLRYDAPLGSRYSGSGGERTVSEYAPSAASTLLLPAATDAAPGVSSMASAASPSPAAHPHHGACAASGGGRRGHIRSGSKQRDSPEKREADNADNNNSYTNDSSVGVVSAPLLGADLQQLSRLFSRVEFSLQMHFAPLHQQRSAIFPRDVGNLLLWAVPASVPLIESPKIFFIKNKSRLRDCVVVYVNGWSYDMMMCTGVGLRHKKETSSSSLTSEDNEWTGHKGEAEKSEEATTGQTREDGHGSHDEDDKKEEDDEEEEVWNERVCNALLQPIRQNLCWARQADKGSSAGGGVQYAPLFIPSIKNTLELDLFWRSDAPHRRRNSRSDPHGTGAREKRSPPPVDTDVIDETKVITRPQDARGSASAFRRATRIVNGEGLPTPSCSTVASPASAVASPTGFGPSGAADAQAMAAGVLWQDEALLEQYALQLPVDRFALDELGFVLEKPERDGAEWRAFEKPRPTESGASAIGGGNHGSDDDGSATATADTSGPKVFALDCEMVLTGTRESQLARATLLNVRTGHVAFDMFVKPRDPVTNYLTRFSGIDEDMLRDVTTTLADCQAALKDHIDTNTFVVGHSLENDFRACKLLPNCRILDTSYLFPHPSGLPYKNALRFLAMRYLKKRIQQGSHDSATDALVSAELVYLKLLNGPSFGVRERVSVLGLLVGGGSYGETKDDGSTTVDTGVSEEGDGDSGAKATSSPPLQPRLHETPSASALAAATETTATRTAAGPLVSVQLFDDAQTLSAIMPSNRASHGHGGRIDAIPIRHDEDATRKAVRALEQRKRQLQQQQRQHISPASAPSPALVNDRMTSTSSFSLTWVQLTQTRDVDVVVRVPKTGRDSDAASTAEAEATAQRLEQEEEEQLQRVQAVNSRVLRIIEACPDESLVIILAGDCSSSSSADKNTRSRWSCRNQHSQAQGAAFFFVKDSEAPGPPPPITGNATITTTTASSAQSRSMSSSSTPRNASADSAATGEAINLSSSVCQPQ